MPAKKKAQKKRSVKKKCGRKKTTKMKIAKKKTLDLDRWAEIFSEGIEI